MYVRSRNSKRKHSFQCFTAVTSCLEMIPLTLFSQFLINYTLASTMLCIFAERIECDHVLGRRPWDYPWDVDGEKSYIILLR